MRVRAALVRRAGLAFCACALLFVAAGCGGGSSDGGGTGSTTTSASSSFTAAQVERLIARSIRPGLVANLGEGYTMKIVCAKSDQGFRCEYQAYSPKGKPVPDQHVIYMVTCGATCSWIPIG